MKPVPVSEVVGIFNSIRIGVAIGLVSLLILSSHVPKGIG